MLFRKMLIQDVKKMLSNVGADLLAIRGVEPDYLSVSVILFLLFFSLEELLDNLSSIECGRCFII